MPTREEAEKLVEMRGENVSEIAKLLRLNEFASEEDLISIMNALDHIVSHLERRKESKELTKEERSDRLTIACNGDIAPKKLAEKILANEDDYTPIEYWLSVNYLNALGCFKLADSLIKYYHINPDVLKGENRNDEIQRDS